MHGERDAAAEPTDEDTGALSDEALARQVQDEGDPDALEQLVRRYLRAVHAVVASILPDPEAIDDAAQETFLRALAAMAQYDTRRPFAPWIYQIARNVARNQLARQTRLKAEPLEAGLPVSRGTAPDAAAERAEIRARVEEELQRLPEQRRIAFRLVDVEGMTASEAGQLMGVSPGTVRSHLHHARRELRQALAEYGNLTAETGG